MTEQQNDIVNFHQLHPALLQSEIADVFGVDRKEVNEAIRLKAVEIAIARQSFREKDLKLVNLIQRNIVQ